MHEFAKHLEAGWQAFRDGLRLLADREPDSVQVELYELAFSYAELSAADQVLSYMQEEDINGYQSQVRKQLVRCFIGETLSNLKSRLLLLRDLDTQDEAMSLPTATETWSQQAIGPSNWTKLASTLQEQQWQLPPSDLNEELEAMRESIRKFTDDVVSPLAEEIHRQDKMIPDEIIDGVKRLGCFALSVPERYGGLKPNEGENTAGMVVVTEELSRGSLGGAGSLITRPEIMVRALLEGGTEEQRQKWLPMIGSGDQLCAVSVTEPDTGSDVASVRLQAESKDGGWVLNGAKTWCTFGGKAGLILLLARTDPHASPAHRGLSLFVIEKPEFDGHEFQVESSNGGLLSGKSIATLGYRGMHSFALFFDNFWIPAANLVGEESGLNRGFYYTMRGFSGGRLQTAARAIGLMKSAHESALIYAQNRTVFGKPLIEYQLNQMKLARMATYIVVIQQLAYRVADLMDRDEGQLEASLVKLIACRYAEWVTREALQIHGGMGYAEETPVSRYFVDARVLSIFEGAEETLALKVVGRALLEQVRPN